MGNVDFNLNTNIKQKTAELKEGAMAMRQVTAEAQKADRQIDKNTKASRKQTTEKKKLVKVDKDLSKAEKQLARDTEKSLRAADRSAKATKRAAKAEENRRVKLELLNASLKRSSLRMAEQRKFDSFRGRAGRGAKRAGRVAGTVGAAAFVAGATKGFRDASEEATNFSDSMTALLSLGDNAQNFEKVRKQVEDLSLSARMDVEDIARAMFTLESATANLSKGIREDLLAESIELARANGTELEPTLNALTTAYQIYGDEVESVADLQNKLQLTQQRGKMTFDDLAHFMPDVASAAQAMGISLDEVNASLAVATIKGGRSEKTFTGLRNVFLRMSDAEEKGIRLTGDFSDKLKQLQSVDKNILKDLFGAEAIAVINNLVQGAGQFNKELAMTKNIQGDISAETLENRKRFDPFFRASEEKKLQEQITKKQQRDESIASITTEISTFIQTLTVAAARVAGDFSGAAGTGSERGEMERAVYLKDAAKSALATPTKFDDVQAAATIDRYGKKGNDISGMESILAKLNASIKGNSSTMDKVKQNSNQNSEVRK